MARAISIVNSLLFVLLISLTPARAEDNSSDLTFRQSLFSLLHNSQFDRPDAAVVAPDGLDVYVPGVGLGFARFRRAPADGTLTFVDVTPGDIPGTDRISQIETLCVTGDGRGVLGTTFARFGSPGHLLYFDRAPDTGAIQIRDAFPADETYTAELGAPIAIASSADGKFVYVLNFPSSFPGSIAVFRTSDPLSVVQIVSETDNTLDGLAQPVALALSPDNEYLYASDWSQSGIAIYRRDATSGRVTLEGFAPMPTGDRLGNPYRLAVSPDNRHVYAANYWDSVVYIFERGAAGDLAAVGQRAVPGCDINCDLIAPADETRFFTVARARPTQVTSFSRDTATGELTPLEKITDGLSGFPILNGNGITGVSPDGANLYVPSDNSNSMTVFSTHRPNLPCEHFPSLNSELAQLQAAYALYGDVDRDGLPEAASFALIEAASCSDVTDAFDEAITNAYLINRAGAETEDEVYQTGEWTPYIGSLATLRMISAAMDNYLNLEFAAFDIEMHDFYVVVTCTEGACEPANARDVAARTANEPFSGAGDPDNDGFTNAEEWANVLTRGGSEREFGASALDPTNDGSRAVSFSGGSSNGGACFIATAAYGTPLAAQLDTLRAFRDRALLTNAPGAAFTDLYYRLSPPAADFIAAHSTYRHVVHWLLASAMAQPSLFGIASALALTMAVSLRRRAR